MATAQTLRATGWIDRAGGLASLVCGVHCALVAFAPVIVATLGLELLRHELFEWSFVAVAVLFAAVAAVVGVRAHHSWWIAAGFGVGALLLLSARLGEAFALFEGGVVLAILGGIVLVGSHSWNTRRARACRAACCG